MKKLLLTLIIPLLLTFNLAGQTCPDCSTVSFTTQDATGYGCNGELFVTFNGNCPTDIQVIGTQYNGLPYNTTISLVTPPTGHFNLKAGSYSFRLTSYDGSTQECSTAFIPFTIIQPVCEYDLQYQIGAIDYCNGLVPVSVWSANQGCTNTQVGVFNEMVINGLSSFNNQPVNIDMPFNATDSFLVYNYDFVDGSLQAICSEYITVSTPGCNFALTLSSSIGSKCDNHKITATVSGGLCFDFWTADLYVNSVYDTTISSLTNTIEFTNLSNGVYEVVSSSGVCGETKTITLNYCPKPYGTTVVDITPSSAKVKWTKQTCALGYQVLYRQLGAPTWITKSLTTNTGNKVLTGLLPSTTYQWKVRTKCQSGPATYSSYSSIKTFTTPSLREFNNSTLITTTENVITELTLAPNPVQQSLFVTFNTEDEFADLFILNVSGQVIVNEKVAVADNHANHILDLNNLVSGIYLVMIKSKNAQVTKRFIKE